MAVLFYTLLALHLIAVTVKLAVLFYTPTLKNKEAVIQFLGKYKRVDRASNWTLWLTAAGMLLSTSLAYLMQMWMLVSMLIYTLIFWLVKRVVIRRMTEIAESKKAFARDEIKKLRFENLCVGFVTLGLLMAIGSLMMTKPF